MKSFKNKVCVVTGAGSGIGRALAEQLAEAGAKLAISDVNQATLDETVASLGLNDSQILAMPVDVAVKEQMQAFADAVDTKFGVVDLIVNNAGLTMAEIQFAAGARKVRLVHMDSDWYTTWAEAEAAIKQIAMEPHRVRLFTAHQMGGCGMGDLSGGASCCSSTDGCAPTPREGDASDEEEEERSEE